METLLADRKESEEVKSLVCLTYFYVPVPTQSQHSENTHEKTGQPLVKE